MLSRLSDAEAAAAHKRLRRAENLYLKAAKAAGNLSLYNKILASINEDDPEDEKTANEHISENMKVNAGEIKYSIKKTKSGEKFVLIENGSYFTSL